MNPRWHERLKRLERNVIRTVAAGEADDLAERQRLLALTVDDPAALDAYNEWLTSISAFSQSNRCLHGRGYCRSCLAHDDHVQAAWTRYEQRIHAITQPKPPTKET
jgi:hypothetical protein